MADRPVSGSVFTLTAIAAVCTAIVASTYALTDERIAANEQAWLEQSLQPVLAGIEFDGNLADSRATIRAPHELPGNEDALVYRVYAGGSPVAALFVVTARDGYSGPIRLLVGIRADGRITGVHALAHRETPGLGDRIDPSKSDWIGQFAGRSLADPAAGDWRIVRDGGPFDQLTGASVTSRAVVGAIRETLEYFEAAGADIFALAPNAGEENEP
jgi:electron transport complex protein RnfG